MAKYLVLYRSSISATEQMGSSDPAATQAGMELWMKWAGRVGNAMADMGSPLATVGTVAASGEMKADTSAPFIGGSRSWRPIRPTPPRSCSKTTLISMLPVTRPSRCWSSFQSPACSSWERTIQTGPSSRI